MAGYSVPTPRISGKFTVGKHQGSHTAGATVATTMRPADNRLCFLMHRVKEQVNQAGVTNGTNNHLNEQENLNSWAQVYNAENVSVTSQYALPAYYGTSYPYQAYSIGDGSSAWTNGDGVTYIGSYNGQMPPEACSIEGVYSSVGVFPGPFSQTAGPNSSHGYYPSSVDYSAYSSGKPRSYEEYYRDGGVYNMDQRLQNLDISSNSNKFSYADSAKTDNFSSCASSYEKKTTWASIASKAAKPVALPSSGITKKKGPGMPPPPVTPSKMDIGTWEGKSSIPSKPPVIQAPPLPSVSKPVWAGPVNAPETSAHFQTITGASVYARPNINFAIPPPGCILPAHQAHQMLQHQNPLSQQLKAPHSQFPFQQQYQNAQQSNMQQTRQSHAQQTQQTNMQQTQSSHISQTQPSHSQPSQLPHVRQTQQSHTPPPQQTQTQKNNQSNTQPAQQQTQQSHAQTTQQTHTQPTRQDHSQPTRQDHSQQAQHAHVQQTSQAHPQQQRNQQPQHKQQMENNNFQHSQRHHEPIEQQHNHEKQDHQHKQRPITPESPKKEKSVSPQRASPEPSPPTVPSHSILEKLRGKNNYNPPEFNLPVKGARFFVIKSYSEDDIHRSIKYEIWCSTEHGNKRLDDAFYEREKMNGMVYLLFSVNGSGYFCGVARMISAVDYGSSSSVWAQDKWKGQFKVLWIYVKDVPNFKLRHIRLENNENKPVTNSRDAQEVPYDKGVEVLKIIHSYDHTTSIFDDFTHYEKKQEEEVNKKVGPSYYQSPPPPSQHHQQNNSSAYRNSYSYNREREGGNNFTNHSRYNSSRGSGRSYNNNYSNPRNLTRQ